MILHAAPKDDLANAIKKLADGGGYSWKATSESPQFNMGPTVGKSSMATDHGGGGKGANGP